MEGNGANSYAVFAQEINEKLTIAYSMEAH